MAKVENVYIDIKTSYEKVTQQIKEIDSQITKLVNRRVNLSANAKELTEAKKEIQNIDVQMKELQAKKAQLKLSDNTPEVKEHLKQINADMAELRARKAQLQVSTTELKGADTQLNQTDRKIQTLNNRRIRLQVQSDELSKAGADTTSLIDKLRELAGIRPNVDIKTNINSVAEKIDSLGARMRKLAFPASDNVKNMLGFSAIYSAMNAGFNLINSSMDGAIKRMDTLNNFPKVMKNLNISTKASSEAIQEAQNHIKGLPTSLDAAAAGIQRMTTKTRDVKEATKYFLAFNDALVAGGEAPDRQKQITEQIMQAFARGKPDMKEVRDMMEGMPAQFDAIAKGFHMNDMQLATALTHGKVSMNAFMAMTAKLDKDGGKNMLSFQQQARNAVNGVGTGLTNMKIAVERGMADVMNSINKMLKANGQGGIAQVLKGIGSAFENSLKFVGNQIEKNGPEIMDFFKQLQNAASKIKFDQVFLGFVDGLKMFAGEIEVVLNLLKPVFSMLGDSTGSRTLGKIGGTLIVLGTNFSLFGKIMKTLSPVISIVVGSFNLLSGVLKKLVGFTGLEKLGGMFSKIFGGKGGKGAAEAGEIATQAKTFSSIGKSLASVGVSFAENVGKIALVYGSIKVFEEAINAMKKLSNDMPSNWGDLAAKFAGLSVALTAMTGLTKILGKVVASNPSDMIAGIVSMVAVAGEIALLSKSIGVMNQSVPNSIGAVAKKIASLSVAVTAMTALTEVLGAVAIASWPAALAGAASMITLAGELAAMSAAIGELNSKVPSDMSGLVSKLKNLQKVVTAVGNIKWGNIFVNAFKGLNAKFVASSFNSITEVVKDLKALSKVLNTKITINTTGIKSAITRVNNLLSGIKGGLVTNAFKMADSWLISKQYDNIKSLLSTLSKISKLINGSKFNISAEKIDNIKTSIGRIKSLITYLTANNPLTWLTTIIGHAGKNIDLGGIRSEFKNISAIIDDVNNIAKKSTKLKFNEKPIESAIKNVKKLYSSFKDVKGEKMSAKDLSSINNEFKNIGTIMDTLKSIVPKINSFKTKIDDKTITAAIKKIKSIAKDLIGNTKDKQASDNAKVVKDLSNEFKTINTIITTIKRIANLVNNANFKFNASPLVKTIQKLQTLRKSLISSAGKKSGDDSKTLVNLRKEFSTLQTIIRYIKNIANLISNASFKFNIKPLDNALKKLNELKNSFTQEGTKQSGKDETTLTNVRKQFTTLKNIVTTIGKTATLINNFTTKVNTKKIEAAVKSLKNFATDVKKTFSGKDVVGGTGNLDKIKNLVDKVISAEKDINRVAKMSLGNWKSKLNQIKSFIDAAKKLNTKANLNGLQSFIKQLSAIPGKIRSLSGSYKGAGTNLGTAVVNGFKGQMSKMAAAITKELASLKAKGADFTSLGKLYGSNVYKAFKTAFDPILDYIDSIIKKFKDKGDSFKEVGTIWGNNIYTGLKNSFSDLDDLMASEVNKMQKTLNKLVMPKINIGGMGGFPSAFATGGLVSSNEHSPFSRGTDTVDAVLTNGEYVMNERAVRSLGTNFFDHVNGFDLGGALKTLSFKTGNSVSQISNYSKTINNVDNSRKNNVVMTQYLAGGNNQDFNVSHLNRALRF